MTEESAAGVGELRPILLWRVLKRAGAEFFRDACPRLAAAISYYAVFSLAPLLVLVILVLGLVLDPALVEGRLYGEIRSILGAEGARQVGTMLRNANRPGSGGALSWTLGLAALLFGATGVFVQLQAALNAAWEVEPAPRGGPLRGFAVKRLLSLGMVLAVGFLLLVSLVLSALISLVGGAAGAWLPSEISAVALRAFDVGGSITLFTLLFAALFVILPDARVAWRDVWIGAFSTAALFVGGKYLIGLYIARSEPGDVFGAAGSLAVVMIWIYYSAFIFLFGAELTQAWAAARGRRIEPEEGARWRPGAELEGGGGRPEP